MGKSAAVVPAVAPVTEPAPITPEETDRTMVTGSNPEESERRRPVEEPLASPEHTTLLDDGNQLLLVTQQSPVEEPVAAPVEHTWANLEEVLLRRTEKETTTAELPATAPVSAPAPVTVPRSPYLNPWRVRELSPQGGGPRRGYSPMDEYFGSARVRGGFPGGFRGQELRRERDILRGREIRRGSWSGRKTPPLMD